MPFGVIVPGRVAETPLEATPGCWVVPVASPALVPELCVVMTQPLVKDDLGVGICYKLPQCSDLEFLGVLSNARPSDVFFTRWPWVLPETTPLVELVLVIEPAVQLLEKMALKPPVDVRLELAKKTALNLFRFVESYQQTAGAGLWNNPMMVLDAWYEKVQAKSLKDPNFIVKTE